jgi:hypothetical protein
MTVQGFGRYEAEARGAKVFSYIPSHSYQHVRPSEVARALGPHVIQAIHVDILHFLDFLKNRY